MAVKGIPGKLTMNADVEPDVEAFDNPHENLDDAQRDRQDTEMDDSRMDDSARIGGDASVQIMDRQIRSTKKDRIRYGYTPGCPRCLDLEAGVPRSNRHHSMRVVFVFA